MAEDTLAPADAPSDEVREKIRSAVQSNGAMALSTLKSLFPGGGVPHIKMGQLRLLMEERLGVLRQEIERLKVQLEQAREEAEAAVAAQRDAEARREKEALLDRITELEEQIRMLKGDEVHEIQLLKNEIARQNGLLEGVDLQHEERIRRIADLEEQLKAVRDALAEAKKEIRRLLSELRYAEPIVMPDHEGFAAVASELRTQARGGSLDADAQKGITNLLRYVETQEEMCRSELPKLLERMNEKDASFPAVARMLRLATLHHEQRRWLGVLNQVLGGARV